MSNNHKADTMLEVVKADIPVGDTIETLGFASKGDGGGAKYTVVKAPEFGVFPDVAGWTRGSE